MADFVVPSILFFLFAVLSAAGAYFLTVQFRRPAVAAAVAVLTLLFFAGLFFALVALMPEGSLRGA